MEVFIIKDVTPSYVKKEQVFGSIGVEFKML